MVMRRSDRVVFVIVAGFMFAGLYCLEGKVDAMTEKLACMSTAEDPHVPIMNRMAQRLATLEGQTRFLDSSVEKLWNQSNE